MVLNRAAPNHLADETPDSTLPFSIAQSSSHFLSFSKQKSRALHPGFRLSWSVCTLPSLLMLHDRWLKEQTRSTNFPVDYQLQHMPWPCWKRVSRSWSWDCSLSWNKTKLVFVTSDRAPPISSSKSLSILYWVHACLRTCQKISLNTYNFNRKKEENLIT